MTDITVGEVSSDEKILTKGFTVSMVSSKTKFEGSLLDVWLAYMS